MDSVLSIIKGVTLYIINLLLLGSRKIWSLMWPAALTNTIMMGYHSCEPYPDLFGRMIPYKSVKNIVYKIPECTRQGVFWETASRNFFLANVTILYPLKTPKNLWVSGVFSGYKLRILIFLWWCKDDSCHRQKYVANLFNTIA